MDEHGPDHQAEHVHDLVQRSEPGRPVGPQFDLSSYGRRNPTGWVLLALFFVILVSVQMAAYLGREASEEKSYADEDRALRGTFLFGAATQMPILREQRDDGLRGIEEKVAKERASSATAARLYVVARHERKRPVAPSDLRILAASRNAEDRAFAKIYGSPRLGRAAAAQAIAEIDRSTFAERLARVHAQEKAGLPSDRERIVSAPAAAAAIAVALGLMLLIAAGTVLLLIYVAMRLQGRLRPLGLPTGLPDPALADKLAVRSAQYMALHLGLGIVIGAIAVVADVPETAVLLASAILLVGLALLIPRLPIDGQVVGLRDMGVRPQGLGIHALWGIAAAVANLPLVLLMALLGLWLFSFLPPPEHPIQQELSQGGVTKTIVLFAVAAIQAPILEELMFRGSLFPALAGLLRKPLLAGLISSAIFAAIHPTGIPAWPALATVGAASCVLVYQTRSLVPSFFLHATHNTILLATGLAIG